MPLQPGSGAPQSAYKRGYMHIVATDMDTEVMLSCSEKPLGSSWLLEIPRTICNCEKILYFIATSIETKTLVMLKYRI